MLKATNLAYSSHQTFIKDNAFFKFLKTCLVLQTNLTSKLFWEKYVVVVAITFTE